MCWCRMLCLGDQELTKGHPLSLCRSCDSNLGLVLWFLNGHCMILRVAISHLQLDSTQLLKQPRRAFEGQLVPQGMACAHCCFPGLCILQQDPKQALEPLAVCWGCSQSVLPGRTFTSFSPLLFFLPTHQHLHRHLLSLCVCFLAALSQRLPTPILEVLSGCLKHCRGVR